MEDILLNLLTPEEVTREPSEIVARTEGAVMASPRT
jgi:hypothetical protein